MVSIPQCFAHDWITVRRAIKDQRLIRVQRCDNCKHEWPIDERQPHNQSG